MRRFLSRVSPVLLVVVLAVAPAAPAAAADPVTSVTIEGSGWGHGIGLSQYGAYGLALDGKTGEEIIRHYYSSGTTVGPIPETYPAELLVGLAQNLDNVQFTVGVAGGEATLGSVEPLALGADSTWQLLTEDVGSCALFEQQTDSSFLQVGEASTCDLVVESDAPLALFATSSSSTVIDESYDADLIVKGASGGSAFHVSVLTAIDPYVRGIYEMPYSWPAAALESQAIAARSYAVGSATSIKSSCNCMVYDDTRSQTFHGLGTSTRDEYASWVAAVEATAGQVGIYDSSVIVAYYSSSSGGWTESNTYLWSPVPVPYLPSVNDASAHYPEVNNPRSSWTTERTISSMTNGELNSATKIELVVRPSGVVTEVTVTGPEGAVVLAGNLRSKFGLYSQWFTVVGDLEVVIEGGPVPDIASVEDQFVGYDPANGDVMALSGQGWTGSATTGGDVFWGGYLGGTHDTDLLVYDNYSSVFNFLELDEPVWNVFFDDTGTSGWTHVVPGDYNGDGVTDLLFYRSTDGLMRFYTITDGNFVPITPIMYGSIGWTEITAGDFNGDGADDVLWYRSTDGVMRFYEVGEDGDFQPMTPAMYGNQGWDRIPSGDFDGDGADDVLYYRSTDGLARLYSIVDGSTFVAKGEPFYLPANIRQILTGNFTINESTENDGEELATGLGAFLTIREYVDPGLLSQGDTYQVREDLILTTISP